MTREVSPVYLRDVATNQPVPAELWDGIEPQNLADWTQEWQPVLRRALQKLVERGVPMEQWPQNWHWNWERKVAHLQPDAAYHDLRYFEMTPDQAQAFIGEDNEL
jgi:hypothetical protein